MTQVDPLQPYIDLALREMFAHNVLRDDSGHRRNTTAVGEAAIVDDERFGTCLELKKGELNVPLPMLQDFPNGITIVLWYKGGSQRLLGLGAPNQMEDLAVWVSAEGVALLAYGRSQPMLNQKNNGPYQSSTWNFLSLVLQRDGRLDASVDNQRERATGNWTCPLWQAHTSSAPLNLRLGDGSYFSGTPVQVARLRIYDRPLAPGPLEQVRRADLTPPPLRASGLPVSLSLEDTNGACALALDGGSQTLTLRAMPNVREPLLLANQATPATATNWQFRLAFRRGTLKTLDTLAVAPHLGSLAVFAEAGEDVLYLIATGNPLLPLEMPITGFHVDPAPGARTTRITLTYQGLSWFLDQKYVPLSDRQTAFLTLGTGGVRT